MHAAILRRDVAAVREALEYGVRFSKQDSEGNLPLHCAVAANDLDIVRVLLDKGAPVNLPNRAGRSPTQVALLLVRCFLPCASLAACRACSVVLCCAVRVLQLRARPQALCVRRCRALRRWRRC